MPKPTSGAFCSSDVLRFDLHRGADDLAACRGACCVRSILVNWFFRGVIIEVNNRYDVLPRWTRLPLCPSGNRAGNQRQIIRRIGMNKGQPFARRCRFGKSSGLANLIIPSPLSLACSRAQAADVGRRRHPLVALLVVVPDQWRTHAARLHDLPVTVAWAHEDGVMEQCSPGTVIRG